MKVLSVRPLWAAAIIYGGKNVENRTWPPNYKGPLLIHASQTPPTAQEKTELRCMLAEIHGAQQGAIIAARVLEHVRCGAIIGSVWLDGADQEFSEGRRRNVWEDVDSEWFWRLTNPTPLERPFYCPGKLRLWDSPRECPTK